MIIALVRHHIVGEKVDVGSASSVGLKGWLAVVSSEGSVRQIAGDQLELFYSLLPGLDLDPVCLVTRVKLLWSGLGFLWPCHLHFGLAPLHDRLGFLQFALLVLVELMVLCAGLRYLLALAGSVLTLHF